MIHKILLHILLGCVWLLSKLPLSILNFLGNMLGLVGYYLVRDRYHVGMKNLTLCFPEMTHKNKAWIIKQHFKYLLTAGLEYSLVFYASAERIKKLVQLNNLNYVLQYYEKQPIILLCPHFVGLDIAALRLSQEIVGYSIYSHQKNQLITQRLKKARLRFISQLGGEIFSRNAGLRPVIKRLRQTKRAFYYLPDQDFGERDSLFVPFFAHPTCATINVLPKLVQMTNAVVIPTFVYKDNDKYIMEFYPAWSDYPSGDLLCDVMRMNKCIENMILRAMPQYFWLHKRFKTQPNMKRGSIYQ